MVEDSCRAREQYCVCCRTVKFDGNWRYKLLGSSHYDHILGVNISPQYGILPTMNNLWIRRKEMRLLAIVLSLSWCGCIVQGRLATQKCEEYKNIIVDRQTLIPLTINPEPIIFDVYNCTNVVQLIVGGEQAKMGEFPHHALLGYPKETNQRGYDFKCGGTLISDQHILTAAHCFADEEPTIVRLGEYDTTTYSDAEYDSDIDSIRKYPNYSNARSYNDIALVKLKHPIKLSKHIRPACLWETEERRVKRYVATGYGYNEAYSGVLSTTMMKVQLDEFPVADCARMFKGQPKFRNGVMDGQLCIGSIVQGRDTCQGDSGGPLQVVSDSKSCSYAVVGITSTGGVCGVGNSKAVYTKVSYYIDWIEDNVWGAHAM